MRERDIERYLVLRVKELGGEIRKVQFIGHRGAPDRVVWLPSIVTPQWVSATPISGHFVHEGVSLPDRTIWVELKAPGKKAEPHQLREHARMRAVGQRVEVVDSFERVDEILALENQQ